jgi:hypothetical protein
MSTEHHKPGPTEYHLPLHKDVAYEPRDVQTSVILKFLLYMGVAVALSFLLSYFVYIGLGRYWVSAYTPPPPSHSQVGNTMPPEPRLQGMPGHFSDPQQDWRDKVKQDAEANNKLTWIDEKAGVAQIPVSDAMKLIAEKGLPAVPASPAEKRVENK